MVLTPTPGGASRTATRTALRRAASRRGTPSACGSAARVGLGGVVGLPLDARAVAQRDLLHGIAAPPFVPLVLARANREHGAGPVAGADDDVLVRTGQWTKSHRRGGRSSPRRSGAPLGEHEEVLLIGFPVVHAHGFARREHEEAHSDLRELRIALEGQPGSPPRGVPPARLPGVDDEPPLPGGYGPPSARSSRASGTIAKRGWY